MAIAQHKRTNFKLKNVLSSGDHTQNAIKIKVNSNSKTSIKCKFIGEGDNASDIEADISTEISDEESAYEESFCSDNSNEESDLASETHRSSKSATPLCRFTSKHQQKKDLINVNKFPSSSKICDDASLALEDRVKSLSLNEVRSTRSVQARPTRKNMSFTNDEVMKIERDNEILLRKIMAQQRTQKMKIQPVQTKISSSAINRRKLQRKIEEDNMMLLRRLQRAKSCAVSTNKVPGYRATYL